MYIEVSALGLSVITALAVLSAEPSRGRKWSVAGSRTPADADPAFDSR
jgi:hypothetical protein